ncbi:hypothetical protein NEPAR04_0426 [Nematocida parisii]|nr:hypothetical protein NEPAR03_0486 [Nematocida parisii]KAI5126484.1 hypothetical protein NEPAR08_0475 [Nematocida parisii]KAI5140691.1 hypothetical protein NEPAR04_0426 [Nematocida parisii]
MRISKHVILSLLFIGSCIIQHISCKEDIVNNKTKVKKKNGLSSSKLGVECSKKLLNSSQDIFTNHQFKGKKIFLIRATALNEKLYKAIERMQREKLSAHFITYIKNPAKLVRNNKNDYICRIVTLRGLCMLSNAVIVQTTQDKDILINLVGVPEKKVTVLFSNVNKASKQKKTLSLQKKSFNLPNGLYVLYACANIHINVDIYKNTIHQMYIRAVSEEPETYRAGHCKRGPYDRKMHEAYARISSSDVALSITDTDIFSVHNKKLVVKVGGIKAVIDRRRFSVTLKGPSCAIKPIGLSKTNSAKWRFNSDTLNKFSIDHPGLTYKRKHKGYLYNRPRRHPVELFEPVHESGHSPLKRVLITGYWRSSGVGMVSNRFLLNLAVYQSLLVRGDAYNPWELAKEQEINYFIAQIYLLESGQITKAKAINPEATFTRPGVEIRNRFPPDTSSVKQGYSKIYTHFPWEFSDIPQQWIDPLKDSKNTKILVPSEFVREVHKRGNIPAENIYTIPHGVAYKSQLNMQKIEKGQHSVSVQSLYKVPEDYARFVMISGFLKRKGMDIGIKAYIKAFKGTDKVVLRIHCAYGDSSVSNHLKSLIRTNQMRKGPKIIYTEGYTTDKKIRGLLANAHYNLAPFRGEGFGMNILDGAALGAVPIVTNAKPATEFCTPRGSFFIRCKTVPVTGLPVKRFRTYTTMFDMPIKKCPTWYSPSQKHLVKLLRKAASIVNNRKYAKMKKNCIVNASKQTWSFVLEELKNLLVKKRI